MGHALGLGVAKWIFLNIGQILILKPLAIKTTQKSGISIHAALPLSSKKTSSISPQIILSVYKTMKPFPWFLIGQLVMRRVKLLRTQKITYVEGIATVLISKTGLGTVANAWSVTAGTHTSKTVAKVFNISIYLLQFF